MLTTLSVNMTRIFTLVTTDSFGNIVDIELFSDKPTFPLTRFHSLYEGYPNGGDTVRIFPRSA